MSDSDPPTRPILSVSIHPVTDGDQEKLAHALSRLAGENPSLTVSTESTGGRFVLGGTSESQLGSVCEQISRELQIELLVGEPRVIYLETIRRTSEAEGKYIRQTGGHGNYAHVKLRLEPCRRGSGYQFVNETADAQLPKEFVEPINLGIQEAARLGVVAGYKIVDLRAVLYDGSSHAEDSNEMAFRFASSIAFKEAARKASPIVLEPVMSVDVAVPEKYLSKVVDNLNKRRGRVQDLNQSGASVVVHAIVPLAELLRSSTHERADYPMSFAGYEPAPPSDWNDGEGAGITADKPESPRGRSGSISAKLDD
jgi:elongation factor G